MVVLPKIFMPFISFKYEPNRLATFNRLVHSQAVIACWSWVFRYIPKGTYLTDYTSNDTVYNSSFRVFTLSLEDFRRIDSDIQKLILDHTIFHKEFHEQ